jgi:hypothetical protein
VLVLYVRYLASNLYAVMHNQRSGSLDWRKRKQYGNSRIQNETVNRVATIDEVVSNLVGKRFDRCYS